jgi:hypothetical protein
MAQSEALRARVEYLRMRLEAALREVNAFDYRLETDFEPKIAPHEQTDTNMFTTPAYQVTAQGEIVELADQKVVWRKKEELPKEDELPKGLRRTRVTSSPQGESIAYLSREQIATLSARMAKRMEVCVKEELEVA